MSAPGHRVPRVGGRVLLLDPAEKVLLIHERIDDGSTHWLTPGGGVEDDEAPADAAVREVFEETGLRVALRSRDAVLVTERDWSWAGVTYRQVDHFYVARVEAGVDTAPRGLTAMEEQTLLGHAWWTVAELHATDEVVVPAELGDVLARVVACGAGADGRG